MKNHKAPKNARQKAGGFTKGAVNSLPQPENTRHGARLQLPQGERLYGQHAVYAALANPERDILALYVTTQAAEDLPPVKKSLRPTLVERSQLDDALGDASGNVVHQGIMCVAKPLPETDLDDVLRAAGDTCFVVLLDQVTDPHNVGAIVRSAAVFGASAVIMTERNAPQHMGTLAKAASGALERVPLVRVVNLARTIEELQKNDFWCLGLAEGGSTMPRAPLPPRIALVMGAEGDGLRRLTKERCDALAALPTAGGFTTLNVSNAAAVAMYHMAMNR